jgi:hypothetical protein
MRIVRAKRSGNGENNSGHSPSCNEQSEEENLDTMFLNNCSAIIPHTLVMKFQSSKRLFTIKTSGKIKMICPCKAVKLT